MSTIDKIIPDSIAMGPQSLNKYGMKKYMPTKLHVFQAKVQKEITSDEARLCQFMRKLFCYTIRMSFENA